MQRRLLSAMLLRAGFQVLEAASGDEALAIALAQRPDFVLSDWMMPEMDGLALCRSLRAAQQGYVYFILLTSRSAVTDLAEGLDAGADDFLTKPVNGQELRARIAAGERILRMERELTRQNHLVSATLSELQSLYDSLNRDLIEAKRLQHSLLPERHRHFGNAEASLLLQSSGHVGGDLVGFFPINARRVGIFGIDVAGHGVASALMTARLAGYLSGSSPDQNVALVLSEFGIYEARPPAEVAATLNRLVLDEIQSDSYFTLIYADIDLISGRVELVQAGHPHPAIQRADGRVEFIGEGGLPIGLLEEASWQGFTARLCPGDRLFLMSDGVTEAEAPSGGQLGQEGLAELMRHNGAQRGPGYLEALVADLRAFTGGEFGDDVSGVVFEFHGAKENQD